MAKKTEAQRERERRAEFDLPADRAYHPDSEADHKVAQREAKHRTIERTQERLGQMKADGIKAGGLMVKFGAGRMASTVKKRR